MYSIRTAAGTIYAVKGIELLVEKKLITIAIPCYNSQDYMETAVMSAVSGSEDVEVLIIDDGSTDRTGEIGKALKEKYPDIVDYIYKENGGHGDAVMCGLSHAHGLYYKVLDSDDYLDRDALAKAIKALKKHADADNQIDMFIANYIYDKEGEHRKIVIDYKSALPQDIIFTWDDVGHFRVGHNLLMHAVIYRTDLLRKCGLTLPKHTFYVDNIFVYYPLPYVHTMLYMDLDLYDYKIGRADQSVNEKVMIGRIDQQLYVNKLMIQMHDLSKLQNEKLQDYMAQYLAMILSVSSALLVREGSPESIAKKEELWRELHASGEEMYEIIHRQILTKIIEKDGKARHKIIEKGYELAQKIYHFN